jgi:serine/threonine protein kinase
MGQEKDETQPPSKAGASKPEDSNPADRPPESKVLADRVGQVIRGKWTLERLIGAGGMAAVYAARHEIGRHEAIKILHPEVALDKELVARLKREAHAVNRFSHPGVVEIRDVDVSEDGEPFLVMELLEGESVARRVKKKPVEVDEALRIAEAVCDVLVAAHAEGVIHRDIKPSNIFLEKNGNVRILDFGVARVKRGPGSAGAPRTPGTLVTEVGTAIGTIAYMPPEQLRGEDIDHRADIYALGATLFRLIGHEKVHGALEEDQLAQKLLTEPARPLHTVAPDVPKGAQLIVDRALAFLPERRYPDAATMLADIRAARAGEPPPYATARIEDGDDPRDKEPKKTAPVLKGTLSGTEGAPVTPDTPEDEIEPPAKDDEEKERRDENGKLLRADTEDGRTEPMTVKRKTKSGPASKKPVAKTMVDAPVSDEGEDATTLRKGKKGATLPGGGPEQDEEAVKTTAMKRTPGAGGVGKTRWADEDGPPSRPEVERQTLTRYLPLLVLVLAGAGIWYFLRPKPDEALEGEAPKSSSAKGPAKPPSSEDIPVPSPAEPPPPPAPSPATSTSAAPSSTSTAKPQPSTQPPPSPSTQPSTAPSSSTSPFPFPSTFPPLPTSWPSTLPPWPNPSAQPKTPPP